MRQSIFGVLIICLFAATYVNSNIIETSGGRVSVIDDFNKNEVDRDLSKISFMAYRSFTEAFAASGTYYSDVGFASSDRRMWLFEHYKDGTTQGSGFVESDMELYIAEEGNQNVYHASSATDGAGFQNTLIWAGSAETPYECAVQNEIFCVPDETYLDNFPRPLNKLETTMNFNPLDSNGVYIPAGQPLEYSSGIWAGGSQDRCEAVKFGTWGDGRCEDSCLVRENEFESAVFCNPSFTQRQSCIDVNGEPAEKFQLNYEVVPGVFVPGVWPNGNYTGPAPYNLSCSTGWCEVPFATDLVEHVPLCSDFDAYVNAGFYDGRTDFEDWSDRDSINFIYSADLAWTRQVYIYSSPTEFSVSVDNSPEFGVGRVFNRIYFSDFVQGDGASGPADFSNVGVVAFRYQTESSLDLALITMYAERALDACKGSSIPDGETLFAGQNVDWWIEVETVGSNETLEYLQLTTTLDSDRAFITIDVIDQLSSPLDEEGNHFVTFVSAEPRNGVPGVFDPVQRTITWANVQVEVPDVNPIPSSFTQAEIDAIIAQFTTYFNYTLNYADPGCENYEFTNNAVIRHAGYELQLASYTHYVNGTDPVYDVICDYSVNGNPVADLSAVGVSAEVSVDISLDVVTGPVSDFGGSITFPDHCVPNSVGCSGQTCTFGGDGPFTGATITCRTSAEAGCEGITGNIDLLYADACTAGSKQSTITVSGQPDITVTKTRQGGLTSALAPGETVFWDIVVGNQFGTGDATNVQVTDVFTSGAWDMASVLSNTGDFWQCVDSSDVEGRSVTCTTVIANIPAGTTAPLTISATAADHYDECVPDPILNTVSVFIAPEGCANDTDSDSDAVPLDGDVDVVVTTQPAIVPVDGTVSPGEVYVCNYEFVNLGNTDTVATVTINTAELASHPVTRCSDYPTIACEEDDVFCLDAGNSVQTALPVGGSSKTAHICLQMASPIDCGYIETICPSVSIDEQCSKDDDVAASFSLPVDGFAELFITKSVVGGSGSFQEGQLVDYSIEVSATGNRRITGVLLEDTMDANLIYSSGPFDTQRVCAPGIALCAGVPLTVNGPSVFFNYTAQISSDLPGEIETISNIATVSTDDFDCAAFATDDASISISGDFELTVTKNVDLGAHAAGTDAVYTIKFENTGTIPAPSVVLEDELPSFMSLNAAASPGWTCDGEGGIRGKCTYSYGALEPTNGVPEEVTITLSVDGLIDYRESGACFPTVDNSVQIFDNVGDELDPVSGNFANVSSVITTVSFFNVTKSAPTAFPGETLTYTINYNVGGTLIPDAIDILDCIPGCTTLVGEQSEWQGLDPSSPKSYTRRLTTVEETTPGQRTGTEQIVVRVDRPIAGCKKVMTNEIQINGTCGVGDIMFLDTEIVLAPTLTLTKLSPADDFIATPDTSFDACWRITAGGDAHSHNVSVSVGAVANPDVEIRGSCGTEFAVDHCFAGCTPDINGECQHTFSGQELEAGSSYIVCVPQYVQPSVECERKEIRCGPISVDEECAGAAASEVEKMIELRANTQLFVIKGDDVPLCNPLLNEECTIVPGTQIRYNITYGNAGNRRVNGRPTLTETVPQHTTFVRGGGLPTDSDSAWAPCNDGQYCLDVDVGVGESSLNPAGTVWFVVEVLPELEETITEILNVVEIEYDEPTKCCNSSDVANDITTVVGNPDLYILKDIVNHNVTINQAITFNFVYGNVGPIHADDVIIRDDYEQGLTPVPDPSSGWTCFYLDHYCLNRVGRVEGNSGQLSLSLDFIVNTDPEYDGDVVLGCDSSRLDNIVRIEEEFEPRAEVNFANNVNDSFVRITGDVSLRVTKEAYCASEEGIPHPGDIVIWRIRITNEGDRNAENIEVFEFPTRFHEYGNGTVVQHQYIVDEGGFDLNQGWTCVPVSDENSPHDVRCSFTLPPEVVVPPYRGLEENARYVEFKTRVADTVYGCSPTLFNYVEVDHSCDNRVAEDLDADASIAVAGSVEISLETTGPVAIAPGGSLTKTIHYCDQHGDRFPSEPLAQLGLTVAVPDDVTFESALVNGQTVETSGCDEVSFTLTAPDCVRCNPQPFNFGTTYEVCDESKNETHQIAWTETRVNLDVTVNALFEGYELFPLDGLAGEICYMIIVDNNGNMEATNVVVDWQFPDFLAPYEPDTWTCEHLEDNALCSFTVASLEGKTSMNNTLCVAIPANPVLECRSETMNQEITVSETCQGQVYSTDKLLITPETPQCLFLRDEYRQPNYTCGDEVEFVMTYINPSNATLTNLVLVADIPVNTELCDAVPEGWDSCNMDDRKCRVNLPDLEARGQGERVLCFHVDYSVDEVAMNPSYVVEHSAVVTDYIDEAQTLVCDQDQDATSVEIFGQINLNVQKTGHLHTIQWNIDYASGDDSCTWATATVLHETLPEGTVATNYSTDVIGWDCVGRECTLPVATLKPGESGSVSIEVIIDDTAEDMWENHVNISDSVQTDIDFYDNDAEALVKCLAPEPCVCECRCTNMDVLECAKYHGYTEEDCAKQASVALYILEHERFVMIIQEENYVGEPQPAVEYTGVYELCEQVGHLKYIDFHLDAPAECIGQTMKGIYVDVALNSGMVKFELAVAEPDMPRPTEFDFTREDVWYTRIYQVKSNDIAGPEN